MLQVILNCHIFVILSIKIKEVEVSKKHKILELLGFEKISDMITDYVETRMEILRVQVQERISDVLIQLLPWVIVLLCFSAFLLFASLALAFYLGSLFHNTFYGFGIVALFYLLLTPLMIWIKGRPFFRRFIENRVMGDLKEKLEE